MQVSTSQSPLLFLYKLPSHRSSHARLERYARADCWQRGVARFLSCSCSLASPQDGERKRRPGRHTSPQRSADKSTALPRSKASQQSRRRRWRFLPRDPRAEGGGGAPTFPSLKGKTSARRGSSLADGKKFWLSTGACPGRSNAACWDGRPIFIMRRSRSLLEPNRRRSTGDGDIFVLAVAAVVRASSMACGW